MRFGIRKKDFLFIKEYQKNRILTFLNPEMDAQMSGYQVMQSKTAVGAGQVFGQGLYNGILTPNNFLPAKHTDFIFAVACEEMGFLGALLILALISFIVFNMTTIPCFAAVASAKAEIGKGKFRWTMLFWIVASYLTGVIVFTIGSWWWTAFIWAAVLALFIVGVVAFNRYERKKKGK